MKTALDSLKREPARIGLLLVLIGLAVWFYHATYDYFPSYIHGWSQSDRYALALGFLDNGFDLFHPSTYSLETVQGITAVDFPFHEFLVAALMKMTGSESPAIFRLLTLLWSFVGVWYFFLLVRRITHSFWKGTLAAMVLFCAPAYAYYQAGFLPSIPAIACSLVGYYYFFRYLELYQRKYLWIAIGAITLGALMRFPFTMILVAVVIHSGLYVWKRKLPIKHLLAFIPTFGALIGMMLWNGHLENEYGSIFLGELLPFTSLAHFNEVLDYISVQWLFDYFSLPQYVVMGAGILALVWVIVKKKAGALLTRQHLLLQFSILCCGGLLYFFLMGQQFRNHDYYFLDALFVPLLLLLVVGLQALPKPEGIGKWAFAAGVVLLTGWMGFDAKSNLDERFKVRSWDMFEYTRQQYQDMDQWLDELVIAPHAKVLVLDGYSTNMPLILMKRKGWVVRRTSAENIQRHLMKSFDYVAIMNSSVLDDVWNHYPNISNQLYYWKTNGKVSLFKRHADKDRDHLEFAGMQERKFIMSAQYFTQDGQQEGWTNDNIVDSLPDNRKGVVMAPDDTYGLTWSQNGLGQIASGDYLITEGTFNVLEEKKGVSMVVSVTSPDGHVKAYKEHRLETCIKPGDHWKKLAFIYKLPSGLAAEDEIKVYLMNPGKTTSYVDKMKVWAFRDQPQG